MDSITLDLILESDFKDLRFQGSENYGFEPNIQNIFLF